MEFPKSYGQCKYMLALRSQKPIIIATGPAGTGKTMLACQVAVERYRHMNISLTRPIVAADEDMGYLPGDMERKMEPWTKPMYDIFEKHMTPSQIDRYVRIEPLGYMRGRTFTNSLILADEMQNSTPNQMRMLLTRIGEKSKLIITGDLAQSDLPEENGLQYLIDKLDPFDLEFIEYVSLDDEDIHRHPAVNEILKVLNA
jgi:phosphate starvation-inducible protein PhoH and related proteins